VAAGGEANVPIDVSGGAALRVAQSRDTPFEHIRKGGVVMAPLLAVGALALVLMVWKLFTFRRLAYRWGPEVEQVAEKARRGDDEGARALALRLGRPLSILLCDGLRHRAASREQMEEVLFEQIQTQLPSLERHLAALAVLGGVAPLLGLLGTVTGMIHTFRLVTIFGTGDARLLSGGISEALITTEFGLAIAIPVLLVHAYLVRRVRGVVAELEQTAATFIHALGAEGANRD
jgi:biopolymer transport protein ExbB